MCEYENSSCKHVDLEAKKYAFSVIEKLKLAKSIKEKTILLKQNNDQKEEREINNNQITKPTISASKKNKKQKKLSLIQKIFAFFKKI